MIKTKIVATVGPASRDVPVLVNLARCGVDMFRINFSHGTEQEHQVALDSIRAAQKKLGQPVAVMGDLCGPKIRVGKIAGGQVELTEGEQLIIQRRPIEGTAQRISTTLAELIDDVKIGERITLDDGKMELKVVKIAKPSEIICTIVTGGPLSSGKGVNLPDTDLSLPALTEKDRADARWMAQRDFDYIALSFVKCAQDVLQLRKLLARSGCEAKIVAKIEKPQAMKNIDAIIQAADAILVARGDMGIEMAMPEVPIAQKRLIRLCERAGKPCIVATQMLETMTTCPTPTRAEVSDVANAVLDGADAVMLSGETAVGKYPDKAVAMMNAIAQRAEELLAEYEMEMQHQILCEVSDTMAAIARAVHTIVQGEDIKAVVTYTASGDTARILGKMRLTVPVLALTPSRRVMQQACLFYGVQPHQAATPTHTRGVLTIATRQILKQGWAKKGDRIIVISGRPLGQPGMTNTLVVQTV